MRVSLYARVSTTDQHPEVQLHALREYARARGLEVIEEFVDQGVSGAKDRRPALDRLLKDAQRQRFDLVACVKLDRLARSVRHLTTLAAEFEALGIGLVVLDQAIDTTTPSGRLLFHVLGAIAEFGAGPHPRAHCSGHEGRQKTRKEDRAATGHHRLGQLRSRARAR